MSGRYHENDPMSDVISDDYRMLQMISRFGITLGFGDKTVAETCKEAGVDAQTFLTVVNFLTDTNHAHSSEMVEHIQLSDMLRYLKNSHTYFTDYRLPAIRRRLIQAIDMRSHIAMLIIKFYDEYVAEVSRHMAYENEHVHPYVEGLLEGRRGNLRLSDITSQHEGSHASIDRSLTELKSIIIKYYPNDQNAALLSDVLMDIYMVEEDFLNHCHLEDTLFAQSVRLLECLPPIPSQEEEEVSTISRSLKGLAKELDIPILALSQLNRGVESREGLEGKRPQLSDLRESGAIEQDADMVLFVHRPEYYHIYQDDNGRDLHGMAQIIIAKHRKGATGDVLLTFRGEFTRFENPEDKRLGSKRQDNGGEILGSKVNGDQPIDNSTSPFGYDDQPTTVPF